MNMNKLLFAVSFVVAFIVPILVVVFYGKSVELNFVPLMYFRQVFYSEMVLYLFYFQFLLFAFFSLFRKVPNVVVRWGLILGVSIVLCYATIFLYSLFISIGVSIFTGKSIPLGG